MKKSSFNLCSTLITAILVAVLLAFTSVAQAKPVKNNPGHDNDGTTTAYAGDGFVIYANAGRSCFRHTRLCEDYARKAFPFFVDGGSLDSFSYAYADWDLSCKAAAGAHAGGRLFVIGGGLLELNRHGKHGSMHHIEFGAGMVGSTAIWVGAGAYADTLADGEVFAIGGTSDYFDACNSVTGTEGGGDIGSRTLETCGLLSEYNFGVGGGFAHAEATGGALAVAGVESLFGMGTWTGVWAANIETFKTVVAAGASNYVVAYAGAQADAFTEAFVAEFLQSYIYACASADITPPGAYVQICADGGAAALALAYARAEAFAEAQALALVDTHFSALIPAIYHNADGNSDVVWVGAFDGGGAGGHLSARCAAPDYCGGGGDTDGDGVCDSDDICPGGNDNQDADGDGVPDACDICQGGNDNQDADGDGVPDDCDICQGGDDNLDADGDGVPDNCDICQGGNDNLDADGDGVPDDCDICQGGDDNLDTDGDGVPDDCDPCPLDNLDDSDGDGVCDSNDICQGGNDNLDTDGDGVPDACDPCPLDNLDDSDGDGVCDSNDICQGGNDNLDADGDGVPDDCDICQGGDDNLDTDGDGVPDACDECPLDNPDDADGDGVCDSDDHCIEPDGISVEGDYCDEPTGFSALESLTGGVSNNASQ